MEGEEKCHFTGISLRSLIIRYALSWFRKNLAKKKYFALFQQLQNISNEGLGYGNDAIISRSEFDLIKRLALVLPKTPMVFDVGANEGDYLKLWLEHKAKIYAFEPGIEAFEKLNKNYGAQASLNSIALGASVGQVDFYKEAHDNKLNSLIKRNHSKHTWKKVNQVECVTLDLYCAAQQIANIDFLKLDTEGYEMEVLKGAKSMLENIRYIQFEFGGAHIENAVFFRDFYQLLSPKFTLYHLVQDGQVEIEMYHEKLENFTGANFLAVNRALNDSL